ncbi:MAG TPA: hypothetical protein VGF59_37300 [Bryobacteraceae bacterium]|jgi:hypothetical protein
MTRGGLLWRGLVFGTAAFLLGPSVHAQGRQQQPGKPIGAVTTRGDLIVMTLDEGALGKANLFDLSHRTLRFTPDGTGYRVETLALQWDQEFGPELAGSDVKLRNFTFPFSGKTWDAFSVGITGSIRFGPAQPGAAAFGGRGGGVSIGRFDQLQDAARALINTVPAICVFFKPRMNGTRYVKELADRVVITWSLSEPAGNIQDFTWVPTVNRFQAVLRRDGSIEMCYDELAAKDAIVGLYPLVTAGAEKELATLGGEEHAAVPAHLDVRNLKLSVVDGLFLKATFKTRGPVLPEGDPAIAGVIYRVALKPSGARPEIAWTIRGASPFGRGGRGGGGSRYFVSGPGVSVGVKVSGNALSIEGALPAGIRAGEQVSVSAEAQGPDGARAVRIAPRAVTVSGIRSPEMDLSAVKRDDGPFPLAYESFHYLSLPNSRDLACTVIKSLGDKFDFLAYYSDFRVDNQEAGTPSNGPLGGNVTGIGQTMRGLESYCSAGRFQWSFVQPVYAGSDQMQERPPEGLTDTNTHNIAAYTRQLAERSADGKMPAYMYAMSQIAHEMGHRWSAFVSAKVNGEAIPLGPTHWARGLQAPVAFPYIRPTEASIMGGGVWQDNFDGTYTQLDDDYYVPATGWSYLDLYLMGLIAPSEVPDFFILRNLVPAGRDPNGHPIFKADRTKVTIQDVIAAEGLRLPDVEHSQRKFNTGMVVIVEHGAKPTKELIDRTNAIREKWIEYWPITTGGRVTMTATPR